MASISTANTGKRKGLRSIQFFNASGKRLTIRLGRMLMKEVEVIARNIDAIVGTQITNSAIDRETAQWLAGISDDLHAKLAHHGLVTARQAERLEKFLARYI